MGLVTQYLIRFPVLSTSSDGYCYQRLIQYDDQMCLWYPIVLLQHYHHLHHHHLLQQLLQLSCYILPDVLHGGSLEWIDSQHVPQEPHHRLGKVVGDRKHARCSGVRNQYRPQDSSTTTLHLCDFGGETRASIQEATAVMNSIYCLYPHIPDKFYGDGGCIYHSVKK